MIRKIVFSIVESYYRFSPTPRGKDLLGRLTASFTKNLHVKAKSGLYLPVNTRDSTFWINYFGRHSCEMFQFIGLLQKGDVFVDIGANQGLFTALASNAVGLEGHVIAFEPNPKLFPQLVKTIELNECTNVSALPIAVTDTPGFVAFDPGDASHSGGARVVCNRAKNDAVKVIGVRFDDLHFLLHAFRGRRTLVKIDTEGHEYSVVCSMKQFLEEGSVFAIICEIDHKNLAEHSASARELFDFLFGVQFEPQEISNKNQSNTAHYDQVFFRKSAISVQD